LQFQLQAISIGKKLSSKMCTRRFQLGNYLPIRRLSFYTLAWHSFWAATGKPQKATGPFPKSSAHSTVAWFMVGIFSALGLGAVHFQNGKALC
jgi:hypothetical protein